MSGNQNLRKHKNRQSIHEKGDDDGFALAKITHITHLGCTFIVCRIFNIFTSLQ